MCVLLALLLLAVGALADETDPEDLGVLTESEAIQITPSTRPDFSYYEVEAYSHRWNFTNVLTFKFTNSLVLFSDLAALPPGKTILGLRSVMANGSKSAATIYLVNIIKSRPDPPTAHKVQLLQQPEPQRNEVVVFRERRFGTPAPLPPPLPDDPHVVKERQPVKKLETLQPDPRKRRNE